MNRGFGYYYREGISSSAKALFRNKNYFRYFAYYFMELIGRLALIFNTLFDLANVRQGKLVRKEKDVCVSQSFREIGRGRTGRTYFVTVCVEGLLFLAGLLMIASVTLVLASVGYGISMLTDNLDPLVFMIIFSVPGGVIALAYVGIMPLIFAPTPYIAANNPDIGVGDTLSACFNTMKANGKLTLFLNVLVTLAAKLGCLAFFGACGYLIWNSLRYEDVLVLALVGWNALALVVYAIVAPIFTLALRAANNRLFEDIVVDPVAVNRTTNGVNISFCKGQKIGFGNVGSALAAMFERTEPSSAPISVPVPEKSADVSEFLPPQSALGDAYRTEWKDVKMKRNAAEEAAPTETFGSEESEKTATITETAPTGIYEGAVETPVSEPSEDTETFAEEPAITEEIMPTEDTGPTEKHEATAEEPVSEPTEDTGPTESYETTAETLVSERSEIAETFAEEPAATEETASTEPYGAAEETVSETFESEESDTAEPVAEEALPESESSEETAKGARKKPVAASKLISRLKKSK